MKVVGRAFLVAMLLHGVAVAASLPAVPSFAWQAPAQVKAGAQFDVVLRLSSHHPLRSMPLLLGFDPQLLQVVSVREGEFFRQANGRTAFSQRIDAAKGRIVVSIVREAVSGRDPSVNGAGAVITVVFKALKGGTSPKVQLLSAAPDPSPEAPLKLPVEQLVRVAY